jgi:hypothetical protein
VRQTTESEALCFLPPSPSLFVDSVALPASKLNLLVSSPPSLETVAAVGVAMLLATLREWQLWGWLQVLLWDQKWI